MDGASKFVKGDAIASLLITGINIVGGIFIGVVQRGMTFADAGATYTVLSVGDGLVTQVPALIISTSAGVIVTYASGGTRMGAALALQIGGQPRALWIGSGVLCMFGLIPGLPKFPFLVLAAVLAVIAHFAGKAGVRREAQALQPVVTPKEAAPGTDLMQDLLQIDPVELEVGYALIPL